MRRFLSKLTIPEPWRCTKRGWSRWVNFDKRLLRTINATIYWIDGFLHFRRFYKYERSLRQGTWATGLHTPNIQVVYWRFIDNVREKLVPNAMWKPFDVWNTSYNSIKVVLRRYQILVDACDRREVISISFEGMFWLNGPIFRIEAIINWNKIRKFPLNRMMEADLVLYSACGYASRVFSLIQYCGMSTTSSIGLSIVDPRESGIRSSSSIGDRFDAER